MSESAFHRRQPPSPLVFTPETVLSPPQTQSNTSSTVHGSGSNTVSMPFVRRHVTRRLKAAKAECDKELQRVTNNITTFFEDRLREAEQEAERERDYRDRERGTRRGSNALALDQEQFHESLAYSEFGVGVLSDDYSSDGGYEAEVEFNKHDRNRAYSDEPRLSAPTLTHWASSPGLNSVASGSSLQMSPNSLRRQNTAPWDRPLSSSMSSSAVASSPASSTILLPETSSLARKPTTGSASRRLSRAINIAPRQPHSGQSSRSTSRSRSPLPPLSTHASFSEFGVSAPSPANRRSSRILVDDPIDPIMAALYDLIAVATDVSDMSIAQLTAQPKVCEGLVQRIQTIGKAWDDHPDWHGKNWYVQILLAVASLSRVVEWWEAEKMFWNFNDDDEHDEPLTFVMKPAEEPTDRPDSAGMDPELENFRLDDEGSTRASLLDSPKKTREETKELPLPTPPLQTPPEHAPNHSSTANAESARVLATERLKLQAEVAHNQNIVIELSLDGDHFIFVNHAWRFVVGSEPEELPGTRVSELLAPSDWTVFKEATQRLREDDSHTIEVRFNLQIEPSGERDPSAGRLYQQMEGKGMLMIDREDGQPSHTMWVVKPIAPPQYERDLAPEPGQSMVGKVGESTEDKAVDVSQPIMVNPILCRICESQIPQWYFEKHSETCAETHRLEAEIIECNESISELRNTIRDLSAAIDRASSNSPPEYRGMPIFIPSASPISSSPLQIFRMSRMQKYGVKKIQKRLLDQLDDILQVALEIAIPALKEEEAKEPIERQRLLSPGSERKVTQVRNWSKPATEDAALGQLLQDGERVMRQKIDNVVRMQNTIRYAEKIWHEWEERVGQALEEEGSSDSEESEEESSNDHSNVPQDDHSSTRSEYPIGRDTSSGPTPLASASPAPTLTPPESRVVIPMPHPSAPIPIHGHTRSSLQTRSSTPSSISSPLALAAPIVAPSSPEGNLSILALDDVVHTNEPNKPRKSNASLLEPRVIITPPASPSFAASQLQTGEATVTRAPSVKRGHRRQSTMNPVTSPSGALSPRQSATTSITRTQPTSIKDFDIIKPISKGAFGSVFLAKKKATGDYFAIKVLKKADMIAKNQITNVKAERMILMKQAESPFVAKLFFTFQSKDNLYLVMEYLNGGDCAALIKSLGSLPEEWTKNYIAEVVLGLEYLHQRGIVHRDLKPDNLLIDQHGHLKLTDFGLSRIGLLGRQTREGQLGGGRPLARSNSIRSRPPSMDSAYMSSPLIYADLPPVGGYFAPRSQTSSRAGYSPYQSTGDDVESSGSEGLSGVHTRWPIKPSDSPLASFATELTTDLRSHSSGGGGTPPGEKKFVGTPDYLAPETILGLRGDDAAVDWWALGVITYEFLYGIPPFHDDTPEKVFENILSGHIEWHEEWVSFSDEVRDFIGSLLTLDPTQRLGSNGADEVKAHPFLDGIDWDKVTTTEAAFIPQVSDPESTDYFDPRGAIPQLFHDDEPVAVTGRQTTSNSPVVSPASLPAALAIPFGKKEPASPPGSDEYGSFSFKNIPVLKQANDDVIRKLKTDQMAPITQALSDPGIGTSSGSLHGRKRSQSTRMKKPPSVVTSPSSDGRQIPTNPPSPATSTSSVASSPSRASMPPPTPATGNQQHVRKPSELGAVERFKLNHLEGGERRNSMPSRLRTASVSTSVSSTEDNSSVGHGSHGGSQPEHSTPPSSVHSIDLRKGPDPTDRAVTCLLAEDNPITAKIIETLLYRLGCRVIVVADGSEAVSVAMGDIKFDCILMDLQMPILDGESAARYIKSTNGKNTNTPIIAVSAYSGADPSEGNSCFAASLAKPLQKADLLAVMRQLGFKTSTVQGGPGATKVTASAQTITARS